MSRRGRGQYKKYFSDTGERTSSKNQRYTSHRSFSKGKEVNSSDQEFQSLHSQRKFKQSNYSRQRSFGSSGQRISNSSSRSFDFPEPCSSNSSASKLTDCSESFESSRYGLSNSARLEHRSSSYSDQMSEMNNNFEDNYRQTSNDEEGPMSLLDEKDMFLRRIKDKKPADFILEYRKLIDDLSKVSIRRNLENIDRQCRVKQLHANDKHIALVFDEHIKNLQLQGEEFEKFILKAKQKLMNLLSANVYEIFEKGDLILESVNSECKLFDKVLPGYSLKSSLLSKLIDKQVVIILADPIYYLNVVLPILLKSEYPDHLFLSCEVNEILMSSLRINVTNLNPENDIQFFTSEDLLNFILKDPKMVSREKNFILILRLPLKRTIVDDILLAKLRDVLEDKQDSRLILLLPACDEFDKYENYFSIFDVDVITPPSLTFPVTTVWRNSPLMLVDDYIDDVIKTILSIHTLNAEGDIIVFLPSISDIYSVSVALREKLVSLKSGDLNFVLLHENKTEQVKWLDMCYQNKSTSRMVFLVTDCAESFVIPTVSFVVDCGMKREILYDPDKKLDVLTTHFISCDKAKLRKKIAGALASNSVCYRLYNKENFCDEMPPSECPEILSVDPFNAMIKVFQHEPCSAADIEFVENISFEVKERALKLLKKSNAIKDNKLTPLGEKMIKLPFQPLYSKFLSLGITWGLAYEAVIIVAFLSVKGRIFKYYSDAELQRKVDAVKCQFIQHDSDTISYLHIYKLFLEEGLSHAWCDKMFLNYDTMKLVHLKVGEICQTVEDNLKKQINREFQVQDPAPNLLEILFETFKTNLCVFTGHYRSGYRMLSSRCISFLHPSSIICQTNELPQFIVFDHMISTTRDFLVNITSIPAEIVMHALTEQFLDFDYSDMFENTLIEKVIEPVGERIIKQVLLGKKGGKLKEIENKVKGILSDESVVIDPSAEKGKISVFASKDCIDRAIDIVRSIIKEQNDLLINSEENHVLKMVNGNAVIPVELKWLKGGTIKSLLINQSNVLEKEDNLNAKKKPDDVLYSVKKSINITSVRRKCRGIALIEFSPENFAFARKYAMKTIQFLGKDVFVSLDDSYQNNVLILQGIPTDVMQKDVEVHFKKLLPPKVKFQRIELKYEPPFETSSNELQLLKHELDDACSQHTTLVDFEIVMNMPKSTATVMKAYVNVSSDEDIVLASKDLSHNITFLPGIKCVPNFSTIIKSSLKIIDALKPRFQEKLTELEDMIAERFVGEDLFRFDVLPCDDQICSLKMSSSNYEILQALQRTIYSLLEGDILDHTFNKDIGKLLCHGGMLLLKSLEDASGVHIVCDYRSKSIRLYGSRKKCHSVKQHILQHILDIETEIVREKSLVSESNSRILLKTLLIEYGTDLENFIKSCGLRLAVINFKTCTLTLHGNEDSINKAEHILIALASSIDLDNFANASDDEEVCPVCVCRAQNLTHRLEICGHLYCFECLRALVLQAQFPIKCCLEGCNQELILEDISKALDYDQAKLDALLEKSMKQYLEDHRAEYVYCPAPDCSMFFSKNDLLNSKHTCPLCQNNICISCNVVYHQGYSCEMFQGSKNDPDYSFKIWQQDTSDCKQCPRCETAIQKNGGCDHMTCTTCRSHFCWVCVQEFPTREAVYDHIPFCPKHPKW